ncbi:MAG: hypothetical protein DMG30_16925 [Acidobacteria bacterium]|nr:MAG: hypothetical protein DMG30_16925 [Acidobacteriota bacterium]
MTGHGEKLSRKQEAAIGALLICSSLPEAASAAGVSQSSLRRWLKNETFARRYREERLRMLEGTINLLRQKSLAAVETLAGVADDKESPAGAPCRLRGHSSSWRSRVANCKTSPKGLRNWRK